MNLKIIYAIILASLYTAIVSYGLWISNGIPYSYDNNESYSSLIHASSISNFGIGESKGLADEAYGKSSAAHPFVHSHQGNYPRIYAWFLYELGATSVETQVLITTMTIGLISILLLYFFIANLSTPWLGLICALVFITDYIFFLQWQFVTYRVWYSFVFFLQFNAIEKYLKKNDKIWLFILFLNTTLFYYGELIYAAFLGLASCLWVVLRSFRHYKILIQLLITMALGLVVAVGILVIQGIEYLGFEIFLEDLKLTFLSRNDVNNVNVVEVKKFYKDNNIVFWENMENRRAFIGFLPFLNSIFLSFIQLNGPVVFLVLAAPLIIYFALKIQFKFKYWSRTDKLSFGNNIWGEGGRYILYSFLFSVPIYFGQVLVFQYGGSTHLSLNLIWMLVVLIVTIVLLALRFIDYSVIFVYCNSTVLIGLLVFYISKVTDLSYSSYWLAGEEVGAHRYLSFAFPIFILLFCFCFIRAFDNRKNSLMVQTDVEFNSVLKFVMVGIVSYTITFFLSPGYLYSGYIVRYAPFLVFFFDCILALSFFLSGQVILSNWENLSSSEASRGRFILFGISLLPLLIISGIWIQKQFYHIQNFPLTSLKVFAKLRDEPYYGSTFISNTYAAPIAVQTGTWAYFDPIIGYAEFASAEGKPKLRGDSRYAWFADRDTNSDYKKPDYYLCIQQKNLAVVSSILQSKILNDCMDVPLVAKAIKRSASLNWVNLVDYDRAGENEDGFVTWAILKFNWNHSQGTEIAWREDLSVADDR